MLAWRLEVGGGPEHHEGEGEGEDRHPQVRLLWFHHWFIIIQHATGSKQGVKFRVKSTWVVRMTLEPSLMPTVESSAAQFFNSAP